MNNSTINFMGYYNYSTHCNGVSSAHQEIKGQNASARIAEISEDDKELRSNVKGNVGQFEYSLEECLGHSGLILQLHNDKGETCLYATLNKEGRLTDLHAEGVNGKNIDYCV